MLDLLNIEEYSFYGYISLPKSMNTTLFSYMIWIGTVKFSIY